MNRVYDRTILAVLISLACMSAVAAPAHRNSKSAVRAEADTSDVQIDGISSAIEDNLWSVVDRYFDAGDYSRSIGLDRIIVQQDPNFVECYATGGWLMESLGNLNDAEAFYQESVANNPNNSYAHYALGTFYFNTLKDYRTAIAVFQSDIRQPDADANDWKMLAHSYERIQAYDLAVDTWTKIKKRWPDAPAVDHNLDKDMALLKAGPPAAGSK
jgi:tetratricopeptide (TPR) repeat protein